MSSNPSKEKGTRAETLIKETLTKYTNLNWQRTPLSGALDKKHGLAGDLYIPGEKNFWCVECKHYKDDHFTSEVFTHKNPILLDWWGQAVRQGIQVSKKPLLIFKHDRSKIFVAFQDLPSCSYKNVCVSIPPYEFFVALLEDWIANENPKFIA